MSSLLVRINVRFSKTAAWGRFVDDETLYITESEECANDFETEVNKFDELAKIFE